MNIINWSMAAATTDQSYWATHCMQTIRRVAILFVVLITTAPPFL